MKIVWLAAFLICIGLAWLAGYRARPQPKTNPPKTNLPRDYLTGLNFLLNEEPDKAVDVLVKMLQVDSETVETHLAVGKLFRRKGEVDRAIRIHQNLIARPQLAKHYREQSLFELGNDYLSAGMLDRAEKVFLELVHAKSLIAPSLHNLVDIYQQARDWTNAIKTARAYAEIVNVNMQPTIAHYYCELAEEAYTKKLATEANRYIELAVLADKSCVRASLLLAKIYIDKQEYKHAIRSLKKIKSQNAAYLSEAIELLALCYENLGHEKQLVTYLKQLLDEYPQVPAVLILSERIRARKGDKLAMNFVADYVRRYPSLRGLAILINLYISSVEGRAKQDLYILQNLMKKLLANKPDYQCNSCGFAGDSLHWQCPGCKAWSSIVPINSLENCPA